MKSPISFTEWLLIAGIIMLVGVLFIILDQIPFTSDILDRIRDYTGNQAEYIS